MNGEPHSTTLPLVLAGQLTLYQLYAIGDEIDLDGAQNCLAAPAGRRSITAQVRQATSIQVAQPPLSVDLGAVSLALGDMTLAGRLSANIYDLGAVVLAAALPLPERTGWDTVAGLFAAAQNVPAPAQDLFTAALRDLTGLIQPAVRKPALPLAEDYCVLAVERLAAPVDPAALEESPLLPAAVLGERRALSRAGADLVTRLSYYPDDLALLSWGGALLIDPEPQAAAIAADLIEFANVELLVLRAFDTDLDSALKRMSARIAGVQGRFVLPLVHRYQRLLHEVQRLVAEVAEVTERIDNAVKVTDDVYWRRLYSAALGVLRVEIWRNGVEQKLTLLRETYRLLHDESEAERASALELTIIILIMIELVVGFLGR